MNEPIRVLQVFAKMNRGGAETMIMNLYRDIDRTKVQFDFIVHTNDQCDFDDEIKALGGSIYRIPRYSGKNHIEYKKAWKIFFEKHPNYRLIHGHVRSTASIYLKVAKKYGLTTIAHSHSTSSGRGISAITKNILQYPIRYRADYLFACSKSAGEWLFGGRSCEKKNFFIVKNAIDSKKFIFNKKIREEKRKELGIENKFVIGHIGRFNAAKNHEFLIDIFKEVNVNNQDTILLLVGDGGNRTLIEDKVRKLGLSKNVIFLGIQSDIHELLQAFDIFVFPSLYEGLPVTLVEAQANGLPCIVSNIITEEVRLTNLIKPIDLSFGVKEWSKEILKLKMKNDRQDISKSIIASGYDIRENSRWIEEFYLTILK